MTAIQDLARAVGYCPSRETLTTIDWPEVEAAISVRLPGGYKEYVETFPKGVLRDYLEVIHPGGVRGVEEVKDGISDITSGYESLLDIRPDFPFTFFPEPGGLIPWGHWNLVVAFFWLPAGDDPDLWPIIACNDDLGFVERQETVPDCLLSLMADHEANDWSIVPPDFWNYPLTFTPWP